MVPIQFNFPERKAAMSDELKQTYRNMTPEQRQEFWQGDKTQDQVEAAEAVDAEEKPTNWEPKVGLSVACANTRRNGSVIGVESPRLENNHYWRVLIEWNDPNSQDTWHDVGELDWMSEYGGLPAPG